MHFPGPQFGTAKAAAYRRADAFVLPSLSEGLPMAILEAWAHEKPVLMTDACNLPEGFAARAAIRLTRALTVSPRPARTGRESRNRTPRDGPAWPPAGGSAIRLAAKSPATFRAVYRGFCGAARRRSVSPSNRESHFPGGAGRAKIPLATPRERGIFRSSRKGVLAQLVERLNGIQEVRGSNPLGSIRAKL